MFKNLIQILGLGGHGAPYLKGRQHEVLLVQNIFAEVFFYWFLHLVSSGSLGQLLAFTDNQPSFLTCLLFRFPLIELLIPLLLFDNWNYIMILVLWIREFLRLFVAFLVIITTTFRLEMILLRTVFVEASRPER